MPRSFNPLLTVRRTGVMAALCGVLLAGGAVFAQDTGIRGTIAIDDAATASTAKAKLKKPQDDTTTLARYNPVSPGATPEDTTASPDDPKTADDPFASGTDSQDDSQAAKPARRVKARQPTSAAAAQSKKVPATNNSVDDATQDPDSSLDPTVDQESVGGNLRASTIDAELDLKPEERARREGAIEPGRARSLDGDAFAPLGIRAGTFILRPSIETGLTGTNNVRAAPDAQSGILSDSTLRLNVTSDWSSNSATVDAYGNFRRAISGPDFDETRAGVDAQLNIDFEHELRGIGTFSYLRSPEGYSSPVQIQGTASEPIRQVFSGSAAVQKDLGKARFAITGKLEHDQYGDADLSTGGTVSQSDRDFTLATAILRGGYEISPALTPFAELEFGRRYYDEAVDSAGYKRSADRTGARAGVALDLNEKLTGEFAAGYLRESFDDDRLDPVAGPSLSANLVWSPERDTLLRLDASTTVEGATIAGDSGSILHSGSLTLERKVRSDLTATASIGGGYRAYYGNDGHDILLNGSLGATYWLNRYLGLTTRLTYEQLRSNLAGRDYNATGIFGGIRIQR